MAKCSAITRQGGRCKLDASYGSFCRQHAPEMADARRHGASKGGRAGGRGRPAPGLAEVEGIKGGIRAVIDGVAAGTVENGAVLFMGYNTLLRAVEVGRKVREADELEGRIVELENASASAAGNRWRS